ncbi:MAG: PQQ-binding-like beta-propeller repeat protein, partial [Acidimicrobiales bacterium]
SPTHPALVAYDYDDGSVRWTSPLSDFPGLHRRWVNGVVMAKLIEPTGGVRRGIFASNPAEFVAYADDGVRLWKRSTSDVVAGERIGHPSSLRLTPSGQLVTVTSGGWLVALDPRDGRTTAATRMDVKVPLRGRLQAGTFAWTKSPAVVGTALYFVGAFRPDSPGLAPRRGNPVHVVRVTLDQPFRLDHVAIGAVRSGASPPVLVRGDGSVLVIAHAWSKSDHGFRPAITAVEGNPRDGLSIRWRSTLRLGPGDDVHAAPALHPATGTLLVSTLTGIHLFRDVGSLEGEIAAPLPIPARSLVDSRTMPPIAIVRGGCPITLAFDHATDRLVGYTNLHATVGLASYAFLAAFALTAGASGTLRPLWARPLALSPFGLPGPGPGTTGQVAPFTWGRAEGLIVNTVMTGTHIFR